VPAHCRRRSVFASYEAKALQKFTLFSTVQIKLHSPHLNPDLNSKPWIFNFSNIMELLCNKSSVKFAEFPQSRMIFLHCITAVSLKRKHIHGEGAIANLDENGKEFIHTKEWSFSDVQQSEEYPILFKGMFEKQSMACLQKNADVISKKYQMILHTSSGRFDGRMFITKRLNCGNGSSTYFCGLYRL
jgi:hypothetical protein